MHFRLREGISYCFVGEQMVFLDIRNDRYFGLSSRAAAIFTAMAEGRADMADLSGTPVERLVERCGVPGGIEPFRLSVPARAISPDVCRKCSVRDAFGIALALLEASVRLRFQSLYQVLSGISDRPVLRASGMDISDAVIAFRKSDALIARQDRCLLKAVALVIYLRSRGFSSRLVMGVALRPFHAHCWVQLDDRLLNDDLDVVSGFVPILAVP